MPHDRRPTHDPRRGVHDDTPSSSAGGGPAAGEPPSRSGRGAAGKEGRGPASRPPPGGGPKALDRGEAGDGRTTHGLTGDDGGHVPASGEGVPAGREPGAAAGLGAHGDTRRHGLPDDPAERTTGGDTPNGDGGIAGTPGGPRRRAEQMPGDDAEDEGTAGGGQSGNDPQRDAQI